MKNIVVVDNSHAYYTPFASFAPQSPDKLLFTDPQKVMCVVFTGGEDVDPSLYGAKRNASTGCNPKRDLKEKKYFEQAVRHKIPMVGICRGSQFLCVMNGGKLVQHCNNHISSHTIQTSQGGVVTVTSTHHQMALPPKDAVLIAWADPRRSNYYWGENDESLNPEFEYEGVYYPKTQSLGMQWHPEYMPETSDGWKYSVNLIRNLLSSTL